MNPYGNGQYAVDVLVNGKRCKQYQHNGKVYIESKDGSSYTLKIKNNSSRRILVVSSVDGLNVINGKSASTKDTGYVVEGYSEVEIKGFRYSNSDVGAFEFTKTSRENSYAATKGNQKNVGVIGIRIFTEKVKDDSWAWKSYPPDLKPYPEPWNPKYPDITWRSGDSSSPNDQPIISNKSALFGFKNSVDSSLLRDYTCCTDVGPEHDNTPDFDMATKWGKRIESKIDYVDFDRGDLTMALDIFYASRSSLTELGIDLNPKLKASSPQSFPGDFAKPPKGWVG